MAQELDEKLIDALWVDGRSAKAAIADDGASEKTRLVEQQLKISRLSIHAELINNKVEPLSLNNLNSPLYRTKNLPSKTSELENSRP